MKQSITLTQDEIEYLAELLDYEIADPEPRMEFLLEAIEIKKLRDRLRKKSIDNPDIIEKLFQSADKNPNEWKQNEDVRYQEDPENWVD